MRKSILTKVELISWLDRNKSRVHEKIYIYILGLRLTKKEQGGSHAESNSREQHPSPSLR